MPRKPSTNLDFIAKLLPGRRGALNLEDAYGMIKLLKKGKSMDEIAKEYDRSGSGVGCFFAELKKAGAAKMTLEQYFDNDRPYRLGKRVVVNGVKPCSSHKGYMTQEQRDEFNKKRREQYAKTGKQS